MIFVCVGSREYQFNRLLRKIDELISNKEINEKVVAQIGNSQYEPKNYEWHRFLDGQEFNRYQEQASLIISHAGTGALIGALKKGKQVIAVPRLAKYGEHIDDHQTQISAVLHQEGYLIELLDLEFLGDAIVKLQQNPIFKKYERKAEVVEIIENFLQGIKNDEKSF